MAGVDINRTTSGVLLPKEISSEIWSNAIGASAVMAAARKIDLPGAGIQIPIITGDPEASWVAETGVKPLGRHTFGNKQMVGYTAAVIEPFSNQFKRDLPALYAECVRRLPMALGKKFDETVFGLGAAPGSDFDQLTAAPQMTVDATGTYGDLVAVYQAIAAAGGDLTHWLATSTLTGQLMGAVDTLGRPLFLPDATTTNTVGRILGAPVVKTRSKFPVSTTVGDTTGVAGDWATGALWGMVEGITISISDQATLTDGASTINLWQQNMFAVRAEFEVGFRLKDANLFVRLTDAVVDTP